MRIIDALDIVNAAFGTELETIHALFAFYLLVASAVIIGCTQIATVLKRRHNLEKFAASVIEAEEESTLIELEAKIETARRQYIQIRDEVGFATKSLSKANQSIIEKEQMLNDLDHQTKALQELKGTETAMEAAIKRSTTLLSKVESEVEDTYTRKISVERELEKVINRLNAYSRLDDLATVGMYTKPTYLADLAEPYDHAIKANRSLQVDMINTSQAVIVGPDTKISGDPTLDASIIDGQVKLMLTAFNIETERLIQNINVSTFDATLSAINDAATRIERMVSSLHIGFNTDYVRLKYDECALRFQDDKKQKEDLRRSRVQAESIIIEQKISNEYRSQYLRAQAHHKSLLTELKSVQERQPENDALIESLSFDIASAETKASLAKSMYQQPAGGFLYVVSNIGAYGPNVFGIGIIYSTEPTKHIEELSKEATPFPFDIHIMTYVEDSQTVLEKLCNEFSHRRVNSVDIDRRFFSTPIDQIHQSIERITGSPQILKIEPQAAEFYASTCIEHNLVLDQE